MSQAVVIRWLGGAVLLGTLLVGCSRLSDPWGSTPEPRVVVTIPPLYSLVGAVAGEHGGTRCLCLAEGPHQYTFNVRDTNQMRRANLFFAIGLQLERSFADPLQEQSNNPHLRYIKVGDHLPHDQLLEWKGNHAHDHHGHEGHSHGEHDPHIWMGIQQAKSVVKEIQEELKRIDPDHAEDYDANAKKYLGQLDTLHKKYKEKLAKKKHRSLISYHESLAYFAKSFDLKVVDVISTGHGDMPSARKKERLVKKAYDNHVTVIAIEPQFKNPRAAEDLRDQLNQKYAQSDQEDKKKLKAKLVEIDPMETADPKELEKAEGKKKGSWYLRKMRQNLDNLEKSLP